MSSDEKEALRAYKISVEYQMLQEACPVGVMVLPEMNNIRKFHGVAFIRTGSYRQGVFRFTMDLPLDYNSEGSFPSVYFTPSLFNPLVNPVTGKMAMNKMMDTWDPTKHFLSTALTCVKKIFTRQSFDEIEPGAAPNEEARRLFDSDRETFNTEALRSVKQSLAAIHVSPAGNNPLRFSEPLPAHDFLRETILGELLAEREKEFQRLNRSDSDKEEDEEGSMRARRDSYAEVRSILANRGSGSSSPAQRERSGNSSNKLETPKSGRLQSFFDLGSPGRSSESPGSS